MATTLYDDALLEKIRQWTLNTDITIVSPGEMRRLLEVISDRNNDSPIKLPLLSLTRNGGFTINDGSIGKQPMSYDAVRLEANDEKASVLNSIGISISYQLDIYTRYYEEADAYARNLVFNFINFPKLTVTVPYNNANFEHQANIQLNPDIEDNSDIPERLVAGQFTRLTIQFTIDDARLWDVRYKDVWSIKDGGRCGAGGVKIEDED